MSFFFYRTFDYKHPTENRISDGKSVGWNFIEMMRTEQKGSVREKREKEEQRQVGKAGKLENEPRRLCKSKQPSPSVVSFETRLYELVGRARNAALVLRRFRGQIASTLT